jgi:hypothetical protein
MSDLLEGEQTRVFSFSDETMTRMLRLSNRLRALFARARSIPGHEPAKHQEPPLWEAEDYSASRLAAPLVKDPWEADPEYRRSVQPSAEISKLGGLPASCAAVPIDGRVGGTSEATVAIPRPVALKEARPIEAAAAAQGQPLTISDLVRSPPELGQSDHDTITVADERCGPVSPILQWMNITERVFAVRKLTVWGPR